MLQDTFEINTSTPFAKLVAYEGREGHQLPPMFHPQTEASEELLLEARRAKDNFLESFKVGIVAVMAGDGIYHESL